MSEPSHIYFPLQANASSLVAGGPARSVRRRLVTGALMHERVFVDAGAWVGHSGPDAMTALRRPKARPPFQTGPGRAADGRVPIGVELRIPGAPESIEQTSDTSIAWRATFEPFRDELEHAYPWIEFISIALPPEDRDVVDAMVDEDTADPGVAARMPDRYTRGLVIGNVDHSLVIGSRLHAAVSMDALHRNIVAARVARGQARPSFGMEALGIKFPAVERMTWAEVDEARGIKGLRELRAVLAAVEAEAWERAQTGAGPRARGAARLPGTDGRRDCEAAGVSPEHRHLGRGWSGAGNRHRVPRIGQPGRSRRAADRRRCRVAAEARALVDGRRDQARPRGATAMTEREVAWDAVHEALPARWRVGPVTLSEPTLGVWSVTAIGPHPGRGKMPATVSGTGPDEIAALRALDARLRGLDHPDGSRMDELRRRLRLAYIEGAEGWSRETLGRGLTTGELEHVVATAPAAGSFAGSNRGDRRHPPDVPGQGSRS